ncbi:MAG: hypothetical protein GY868_06650 [Deltaproteobacteria bacterium]|nr:hypothetical protein [Deltaproteobacteria bacterium]
MRGSVWGVPGDRHSYHDCSKNNHVITRLVRVIQHGHGVMGLCLDLYEIFFPAIKNIDGGFAWRI